MTALPVAGLAHVPGTALPEGTFTISRLENDQLADVLGQSPYLDAGHVHPLWAYIATQRGIGVGIAELCAIADFDVNDGPMLGSVDIEYSGRLQVDVQYRVVGEVVGIERKSGRRVGTFDVLTYRERLLAPDNSEVATVTNSFILPRRDR